MPRLQSVYPTLTYDDGRAAIEFICNAFGFERLIVVPGPDETIAHAELVYEGGVIMLGSAKHRGIPGPAARGHGADGPYVVVEDLPAHYARAIAAGAVITRELKEMDYGGGGYSARDPEGYDWSFGGFRPDVE